jgi:hypothetical protein
MKLSEDKRLSVKEVTLIMAVKTCMRRLLKYLQKLLVTDRLLWCKTGNGYRNLKCHFIKPTRSTKSKREVCSLSFEKR